MSVSLLKRQFAVFVLLLCVFSHAANAALVDGVDVDVMATLKIGDATPMFLSVADLSSVLNLGGGDVSFVGDAGDDMWSFSWDMTANADPFIDTTFTIDNLSASTQTFALSFTLPINPPFAEGVKTGSLGFSFVDFNEDGSASVVFNSWDGTIDGVSAMSLFTASVPCSGIGCSGSVASVTEGPLLHPGGVSSTLGIELNFDLSPGDVIIVNTRFEVSPVPVPAAVWLFSSALFGLGFTRVRRQKHLGLNSVK